MIEMSLKLGILFICRKPPKPRKPKKPSWWTPEIRMLKKSMQHAWKSLYRSEKDDPDREGLVEEFREARKIYQRTVRTASGRYENKLNKDKKPKDAEGSTDQVHTNTSITEEEGYDLPVHLKIRPHPPKICISKRRPSGKNFIKI